MTGQLEPQWLNWVKELQAIAQTGLTYSANNYFDRERYTRIREIEAKILASGGEIDKDPNLSLSRVTPK